MPFSHEECGDDRRQGQPGAYSEERSEHLERRGANAGVVGVDSGVECCVGLAREGQRELEARRQQLEFAHAPSGERRQPEGHAEHSRYGDPCRGRAPIRIVSRFHDG